MILQYQPASKEELIKEAKAKAMARMKKILGISFLCLGLTAGITHYNKNRSYSLEQNLVSRINPYRNDPLVKDYRDLTEKIEDSLEEIPSNFKEDSSYPPYLMKLNAFPTEINNKIQRYNRLVTKKEDLEWDLKMVNYKRWNNKKINEFGQVLGSTSLVLDNFLPYETIIILGSGIYGILKGRKEIKALDSESAPDSIPFAQLQKQDK